MLFRSVTALCKRINDREKNAGRKEIILKEIIGKPPSAELRPNQKDQDSLPPYEVLDTILKLYLYEELSAEEIAGRGIELDLASRIIKTVEWAEFKRRQMPPVLMVSSPGRKIFRNTIDLVKENK